MAHIVIHNSHSPQILVKIVEWKCEKGRRKQRKEERKGRIRRGNQTR